MSHARPGGPKPGAWKTLPPHQRFTRLFVLFTAGIDISYGGVYAFGGFANSASQALMREVLPMPIWGLLLMGSGIGFVLSKESFAGVFGGAVWLVFSMTSLASVVMGTALSSGGPALLVGVAAIHLLITYGAAAGYLSSAR